MGTGKTTIGQLLAKETDMEFVDMDALIEEQTGEKITVIFATMGEARFRELESKVLSEAIRKTNTIFSTGGGIVLDTQNRKLMKTNGVVISLKADADTLWARLKDKTDRPLLKDGREALDRLYEKRSDLYEDAHFSVQVDDKTPEQIVEAIRSKISLFNPPHLW